jgi:hypothetical protein
MQALTLKAKGIYSFPNPLGSVPEGALQSGQNFIIDRDDTIETRRGQKQYGTTRSSAFQAMYNFNTTLMGWDGTNFWYDSNAAGTWTMLSGSYSAPSGTYRIKGAEASGNMYFGTSTGIVGLTSPTSTLYTAGVPFPLDSSATLTGVVGAFFSVSETIGYRMVLGYTDTNSNLHISAPSQRLVLSNPAAGAASTVTLTWSVPPSLPTGYFYQIYRTKQTAFVGGVAQDPGDEMYLVVQKILTSTDISNKYITYTDVTPDALLGQSLYTNPSQQTVAGANYAPPLAKDMVYYKGNMLFANTTTKQQTVINMITTPTANDTLTIGGIVYTAKAAENAAAGEFKVYSTGTAAQNIDDTARSLVHVINAYASNTSYWAIYTSGYTSLPGQITLQERSIGGVAFAVTSSNGTVYSPQIPSSGTTYISTNSVNPHYVYSSKVQIPEAVPLGNYIPVGTSDKAILRILALRDSVFVFKEDGIYRILGTDITNFQVSLFDSTVILTAIDSAVLLNNQIWCMTNQGVVAVSDSGTVIMSRAIERDLLTLSSALYTHFPSATFGIRYESDRHYMLACPTNSTDSVATQIWVYNFLTQTWSNWPKTITAGIVALQPVDKLYLMESTASLVSQERKNWNIFDYADFEYAVTVVSSVTTSVTLASTTNLEAGMTLYQEDSMGNLVGSSIITDVVSSTVITVTDTMSWIAGAATVYAPISVQFKYAPSGGNQAWVKHFQDFEAMFRDANFTDLTVSFSSDFDASDVDTHLIPSQGGGFGTVPFGEEPFGGVGTIPQVARTLVPRQMARAHWLTPSVSHSEALSNFALTGINLFYTYVSSRMK